MMTQLEFNEVFNLLCVNYPNTKNKNELGTLYFMALGNELTKKEFLKATLEIIKTSKKAFMPQVAEILEVAKKITDIENQIFLAKKLLKIAIRKYGSTGMIVFEDKGLHAVIDFMSWNRICMMSLEEFDNFMNFKFDGIYKRFLENPYKTSEYYRGRSDLIGQKYPRLITYKSIGVNNENLKFVKLEYNQKNEVSMVDYSKLKEKMMIGE